MSHGTFSGEKHWWSQTARNDKAGWSAVDARPTMSDSRASTRALDAGCHPMPLKLFISYSHKDKADLDEHTGHFEVA